MDNSSFAESIMYKLVVVSDSHHDFARLEKLLPVINSADYLIFCGDGVEDIMRIHGRITVPVVCVRGNNDFGSNVTELVSTKFGETKALITHGHKFGVRHGLNYLYGMADMKGCHLVFFGHTHAYLDRTERGVHFINPGALCTGSYALVAGNGVNFVSKQGLI